MTDKLPKLKRFNVYCDNYKWVCKEGCEDGSQINVADLIAWIRLHCRESNIANIYSDLLKALGEGDKV